MEFILQVLSYTLVILKWLSIISSPSSCLIKQKQPLKITLQLQSDLFQSSILTQTLIFGARLIHAENQYSMNNTCINTPYTSDPDAIGLAYMYCTACGDLIVYLLPQYSELQLWSTWKFMFMHQIGTDRRSCIHYQSDADTWMVSDSPSP